MSDEPPVALTDLLAKLHLATPEQVRGVRGRARGWRGICRCLTRYGLMRWRRSGC